MRIHKKAKRRVLLLLLVVIGVTGIAAGAYSYREHQLQSEAEAAHQEGLEAFEAGNYELAMHKLGTYVSRSADDIDALYKYGQAREKVVASKGKHIFDAMAVYRRVLDVQPGHKEARDKLMQLYIVVGFNTEALQAAESSLREDPEASEPLRIKAIALMRLQRYDEAFKAVEKYTAREPKDLNGHLMMLTLLPELGRSHEEMLAYAENLRKQYPDDPRFDVLQAVAYRVVDDFQSTEKWALAAAEKLPPDATTALQLVSVLDDVGRFDQSLKVLENFEEANDDDQVRRMLVRRIWQGGDYEAVLTHAAKVDQSSPSADAELLGLKALSLKNLGRDKQAQEVLAVLADRDQEPRAVAWHRLLTRGIDHKTTSPVDRVNACLGAVSRVPGHPHFLFFLGQAYHEVGEQELAMDAWQRSSEAAPSWPVPSARAAIALLESGRKEEALDSARTALRRAPSNLGSAVTYAQVWFANVESDDLAQSQELLKFINQIQEARPGDADTLPLQVALIARIQGADETRKHVTRLLEEAKSLDEGALRRLAMVCQRAGLESLADQLVDLCIQQHGMSPQIAYDRALILAQRGQTDEARTFLNQERRQAAKGEDAESLQWDLAWANFLRRINDPEATSTWVELADAHPDNSQVQRFALNGNDVWANREFSDRAIKRMRDASGERSIAWRVARARWLIRGNPDKREAAEAANLLSEALSAAPNLVEARLLLADAFLLAGIPSAATEQLRAVLRLQPENSEVQVKLAKLAHAQGDSDAAVNIANRALRQQNLSPDQLRDLVLLLAQQGQASRAVELLVQSADGNETPPNLLLAVLYRRQGELQKADQIVTQLLQDNPTLAEVDFAADLYASQGEMDRAEAALDRLADTSASAADKLLINAAHYTRHGTAQEALTAYEQAVQADPEHAAAHLGLLRQLIRMGEGQRAQQVIEKAQVALPEHELMSTLHRERSLMELSEIPAYRPVLLALMGDGEHRPAIVNVLRLLQDAKRREAPAEAWVPSVHRLVQQSPRSLELQQLSAHLHLATNRPSDAAAVALQAMQAFPVEADPAALATRALAQSGRWHETLSAAQEWRKRTQANPTSATVAMAEAHLALDQPKQALEVLQPLLERASAAPADHPQVVRSQARALVRLGQRDEAASLLRPQLDAGPTWRGAWMELAVDRASSTGEAAAWLSEVEPHLPQDATDEWVRLAEHWLAVSNRSQDQQQVEHAISILTRVADASPQAVEAPLLLAYHYDQKGQYEQARKWYEQALQRNGDLTVAQNNLAMVLVQMDQDLDRAYQLAKQASEATADNPYILDTLAAVEQKRGNLKQAVDTRRQVAELDPSNPQWQLALAMTLAQTSQREEAQRVVNHLLLEQSPEQWNQSTRDMLAQVRRVLEDDAAPATPGAEADTAPQTLSRS